MNIDQDRHMLMADDNVRNQFRENAMQNVGHLDGQNAVQNQGTQNVRNQNGLSVVPGIENQHGNGKVVAARAEGNANGNNGNQIRCYNCQGEDHLACNCTVKPGKQDVAYLQKQMQIALKEEAGIQLTQEEFDFMADAGAYEEIERVNANCILKDNLQQASTSGTQTDKALVYDSDESAELLEPIPKSHQVPHNDSNVIYEVSSVEQSGGTVEQHPATPDETRALYNSLYNNLATEVEKVNLVNRKPPSFSRPNRYCFCTYLYLNSTGFSQGGEANALSNFMSLKTQFLLLVSHLLCLCEQYERVIAPGIFRSILFKLIGVLLNPQEPHQQKVPKFTFSMSGCQNGLILRVNSIAFEYNLEAKSFPDGAASSPGRVKIKDLMLNRQRLMHDEKLNLSKSFRISDDKHFLIRKFVVEAHDRKAGIKIQGINDLEISVVKSNLGQRPRYQFILSNEYQVKDQDPRSTSLQMDLQRIPKNT
ncbi:hypothetical protein Tco_0793990 [Tanacetum coccineum]